MHATKVIALLVTFVGVTMALPAPAPAPAPEPVIEARWKFGNIHHNKLIGTKVSKFNGPV
ncbi:hypothetical protein TWF506_009900 [Arthrobotrys conoides]|uniref:Uncharacterized protein n=1 Tax=Arthrobotrys conoides TaxID=74498 RepID=A0AAN8RSZ0_9PEZI